MPRTSSSPLQKAVKGEKVTDRQAQGALSQAVSKISSLTKKAQKSKEAMAETGAMVIHTAETQGSLFLASMAEGYFGSDKLKIGNVDLRAPVGLLAQGYGLYETMSGKGNAGGHALALGNGVFGSWLASVAVNAGKTLAEKRGQPQAPQPQPAVIPQPTTMQGQGVPMLPEPFMAGPVREVLLTPEPVPVHASVQGHDDDFEGRPARPHRRRRRRPNRFVRSGDDD